MPVVGGRGCSLLSQHLGPAQAGQRGKETWACRCSRREGAPWALPVPHCLGPEGLATHACQGVEEFCALTLDLVGADISLTTCGFETMEKNKEQVGSILGKEESLY